ncbi:hypothetical protein Peur_031764 [Populus x canadensis]
MKNLLPEDSDLVASSYSWLAYLRSSDLYDMEGKIAWSNAQEFLSHSFDFNAHGVYIDDNGRVCFNPDGGSYSDIIHRKPDYSRIIGKYLDDHTLFLSDSDRFALCTRYYPQAKSNSIFFIDSEDDVGIFNSSIERIHIGDSERDEQSIRDYGKEWSPQIKWPLLWLMVDIGAMWSEDDTS